LKRFSCAGESLPEDSGLKVFQNPNIEGTARDAAHSSSSQDVVDDSAQPSSRSAISASSTPAVGSAPEQGLAEEDLDDETMIQEGLKELCNQTDEHIRLLAMSPWIRVVGELRAAEEQKLVQVCRDLCAH
jgi:hypothetical protein